MATGRHRVDDSAPMHVEVIPSSTPLLNRHVVHDPRSWDHPLPTRRRRRRSVQWQRHGPILDQNTIDAGRPVGCCTAGAGLGLMMTGPFWTATGATVPGAVVAAGQGLAGKLGSVPFADADVLAVYSAETAIDDSQIPGRWRPDDTGSSGLWLMKTLRAYGLITGWRNAFSLDQVLDGLQDGPVALGLPWLRSMFDPRPDGSLVVDIRSGVAGGHEIAATGWEQPTGGGRYGWTELTQTWGEPWGQQGRCYIRDDKLGALLGQQGDGVQPLLPAG